MYVKFPALCSAIVAVSLLSGCASRPVKPESMAVPAKLTCFVLPVALVASEKRGIFNIVWNLRLERGPYVSTHEDSRGTYFRGPPGTVNLYQSGAMPGTYFNGGIFVPRDGSQPSVYTYLSAQSVPAGAPPKAADCTNAVVVRDPVGTGAGISVMSYTIGGGIGGAAGAGGIGAVGGAIGMGLVAMLANLDVGKIEVSAPNGDVDFNIHLSAAANGVAPLKTN